MIENNLVPDGVSISGKFYEILKRYAEENGVVLPQAADALPPPHIPVKKFSDLFNAIAGRSGDPDFGLHLGERYYASLSGSVLAGLQANSADIGQAVDKLCRYHNLMGNYVQLRWERQLTRGILYCQTFPRNEMPNRQMIEAVLSHVALSLRQLTRGQLHFSEVQFCHPRPRIIREHQRLFGCRVIFGQAENALVLKAAELEKPVFLADSNVLNQLERIAQEALKKVSGNSWTWRVEQSMQTCLLSSQTCSLSAIASRMAVSRRLLQKKLQDEKTTFRRLLDHVRKQMALAYLRKSDVSILDIAFILGFAEQSAFNHAFRRWTGHRPGKYR